MEDFCNPESSQETRVSALNTLLLQTMDSTHPLRLSDLVASSSLHLNSPNATVRRRAVLLLAEIALRNKTLDLGEGAEYLAAFAGDRLQDESSMGETLKLIRGITANPSFWAGLQALSEPTEAATSPPAAGGGGETVTMTETETVAESGTETETETEEVAAVPILSSPSGGLIVALMTNLTNLQGFVHSTRKEFYLVIGQILAHPFARSVVAAPALGPEFVFAFIQAMEGEKDPRNLAPVFADVVALISHVPSASRFVEDLFEITSCYFPITLRTPPGASEESLGFSVQGLVSDLRTVLTASDDLAPFSIPFFLDKLSASLAATKAESLTCLASCVAAFSPSVLAPWGDSVWSVFREELLGSDDIDFIRAAIPVLRTYLSAIHDSDEAAPVFASILRDLSSPLLDDPDAQVSKVVTSILCALIECGPIPARAAYDSIVPALLAKYGSVTTPVATQNTILGYLLGILIATLSAPALLEDEPLLSSLLAPFLPPFVESLTPIVTERSDPLIRKTGMLGIKSLLSSSPAARVLHAISPALLPSLVATSFGSALNDDDEAVREQANEGLVGLAELTSYPDSEDLLNSHVLAPLLEALQNHLGPASSPSDLGKLTPLLDTAGKLSGSTPSLFSRLANALSEFLVPIPHPSVLTVLLPALDTILKNGLALSASAGNVEDFPDLASLATRVVTLALTLATDDSVGGGGEKMVSPRVAVPVFARAARALGRVRLMRLLASRVGGDGGSGGLIPSGLPYLLGVLGGLEGTGGGWEDEPQMEGVMRAAIELSVSVLESPEDTSGDGASAGPLICLVVNRHGLDVSGGGLLRSRVDGFVASSDGEGMAPPLLGWILRGMLMAGEFGSAKPVLEHLVSQSILTLPGESGTAYASVLGVVLGSAGMGTAYEPLFTLECGARLRIMYKQRVFATLLPQLLALYEACGDTNVLIAVSHLLQGVPKAVLEPELDTLLPLLISALTSDSIPLQVATVTSFASLAIDVPSSMAPALDDLLPTLLSLSRFRSSVNVRLASLSCLGALAGLSEAYLRPYVKRVVRVLGQALDDPKRAVRSAAVGARNKWSLL